VREVVVRDARNAIEITPSERETAWMDGEAENKNYVHSDSSTNCVDIEANGPCVVLGQECFVIKASNLMCDGWIFKRQQHGRSSKTWARPGFENAAVCVRPIE